MIRAIVLWVAFNSVREMSGVVVVRRPGTDHLFLVDKHGTQHIDCAGQDLPYGRQLISDVLNRTETAMPQVRAFKAMELALTAQKMAEVGTVWQQ